MSELLFDKLFVPQNIDKVAEAVVESIGNEEIAPDQKVDYDFHLTRGQMEFGDKTSSNTSIRLDAPESGILSEMITSLEALDDETATQERGDTLKQFCQDVTDVLNNKYLGTLRNKVRWAVLNNDDDKVFPLTDFNVLLFEMGDLPSVDYVISVQKNSPISGSATGASKDLMERHIKTGDSFEKIIAERKAMGDNKYRYVVGATKEKYWYEIQLDMWVDFSANIPPEEVEKLEKKYGKRDTEKST